MDAMVEGDVRAPTDVPQELGDDVEMRTYAPEEPCDDDEMHEIERNKTVFRIPQKRFMELFHMFNDVKRTPKSVAHAIHDHLGSPHGLKIFNIQARV